MPEPRTLATRIWQAGVDAVRAETLIHEQVMLTAESLTVGETTYSLSGVRRIAIVGAGKAAGYLATALEQRLEQQSTCELVGWVNVPENCVVPSTHVTLHAARPAGINEPRAEGVQGTEAILSLVASLDANDLCICVLTGGGSALLPCPAPGISLEEKLAVTRLLSARGASIEQLNAVRTRLSSVKGGGLARACQAGRLITLIISDVIGDPLQVIASGPTVMPPTTSGAEIRELLSQFADAAEVPPAVWRQLEQPMPTVPIACDVSHHILANNQTAVAAAAAEAEQLGLSVSTIAPESADTRVADVATQLARALRDAPTQHCVLWGGEPVIELATAEKRGRGGRNMQLVLEALAALPDALPRGSCLLSGGTDGEDGPTDAAGGFVDESVSMQIARHVPPLDDYLSRNDAYTLLEETGGLLRTGPTHTNVCDLRVAVRP